MTNPPPKLYASPAQRRWLRSRWLPLMLTALGLLLFLLTVSVMLAFRSRPRVYSTAIHCAHNLMQISRAIALYADSNRGRMAPDFATLAVNEDLDADVFVCGSTNDQPYPSTQPAQLRYDLTPGSGFCSYVMLNVDGPFAALPSDVVLAYEPPANHPELNWANVLLADLHVERVDVEQVKAIAAAQQAGQRNVRLWPR